MVSEAALSCRMRCAQVSGERLEVSGERLTINEERGVFSEASVNSKQ